MLRIALFGTSADPPTLAHQEILTSLAEAYDRVVVWAADNPFKQHGANLAQRTEMLGILIHDLPRSRETVELHPELSSRRTIETLEKAQQLWINGDFTLVIGSDLVAQIPTWYRADGLLSQVHVLVIPRPNYPVRSPELDCLRELARSVAIAEIHGLNVSSTAYREHRESQGITPAIAAYIQQEHLYEC